jgi:hypothetical protein
LPRFHVYRGNRLLVCGLVFAGRAAGLAIEEAVGAETDVHDRLAEAAEFFALARTLGLFALGALVFGGAGSVTHELNVAQERDGSHVTEVTAQQWLLRAWPIILQQ